MEKGKVSPWPVGAKNSTVPPFSTSSRAALTAGMAPVQTIMLRAFFPSLADRLHNMRTLEGHPSIEKRKRIAKETLDIFAPVANRLGMRRIKWELEDLSFRYLHPEIYQQLKSALAQRRDARERFVRLVEREIRRELAKAGIKGEVSGRPKHIYSIWRKMQRKGIPFEEVYDVHGFRIIVDSVADCYTVLGLIHSRWTPIPGEFDDYIARPKDNGYRSTPSES